MLKGLGCESKESRVPRKGADRANLVRYCCSENADSATLKFLPASLVFFPCSTSSCDLMGLN